MKQTDISVISFKRNILFATFFLMLSIICLYTWASLAPLDSASIAPGFVRAEGQNQKVEHLFGGKVDSININNGDFVQEGDVLITLDNRENKTALTAKLNEYLIALAHRDIANVMLNASDKVYFSKEAFSLAKKLNNVTPINVQEDNLKTTRQVRNDKEQILRSKSKQIESVIQSEYKKLASLGKQLELSEIQLSSYNELHEKKHMARLQVIEREKEIAQLKVKIHTSGGMIEEKQLALHENGLKIQQLLSEEKQHAAIVMVKIEDSLPAMRASITRLQHGIEESEIKATVSGKVTELSVSSVGETIKPGEELMKILPQNDKLIVEARLNTSDIDSIVEGQTARVRLTAYNFRNTSMLDANITKISADRLQDDLGHFYQVQLEIDKNKMAEHPNQMLTAGMPAEIIIINDKRTVLDYLIEPIKRGINRSMRES